MPGINYINLEVAKDQLKKLNVRYPTVETLLNDDALVDWFVEKELESIGKFKEDIFIHCGKQMFKPRTESEKKDQVDFSYNQKDTDDICGNTFRTLKHIHGIYPGYHSDTDMNTHKELFQSPAYMEEGAVAGIDGIHVYTHKGHWFKFPFSDEFYAKVRKNGHTVIDNVKNIECNLLSNKKRDCKISLKNGMGDVNMIVDEIAYEEPSLRDAFYAVQWIDEKTTRKIIPADFSARETMCVILDGGQKKSHSILSCFHRDV